MLTRNLLVLGWLALVLAEPRAAHAQSAAPTRLDSLFARARQLVSDGNGAAGRALVDSVLGASSEGSSQYADALYWRAVLAESASSAQHDYLRLAIEYPASPHAADALLRLAQLELARGERDAALRHLERLGRDYPASPLAPRAHYWRARTLFETNAANALPSGCASIARARATVSATDVELRNQIDYYGQRCAGVDTTVATTRPDSGRMAELARKPAMESAPARSGRFAVQVAAFRRKGDAESLATRLRQRGMESRVVSSSDLHRVWIGRYATRREAATALAEFKRAGIEGFVVEGR